MKNINEYDSLSIVEKENFIAHQAANLVQSMYYSHDRKGLEVFRNNLLTISEYASNCMECLDILHQKGDVFAKIYLLLEYMGKDGINEQFVSGLEELTERAQVCLDKKQGLTLSEDEERNLLDRMHAVMDKKEAEANNDF